MSLKVWLPLTGDLHNLGASDLEFSTVSTNTSVNTSGKIGSCYYNNSNTAGGLISNKTIDLTTNLSMFCWFKFDSLISNSSLGGSLVSLHRHSSNRGMGITIRYVSSTTGYLSVNTGNGSSRTYNTYYGTTLLLANTWYHGGYTYDGSNIRIYVNGVCEKTQAFTGMSVPADRIMIFCWSFADASSNTPHSNYKLKGYINDVRVYDHCLSAAEVHEISLGLVLHYKLDGYTGGITNPNLISNIDTSFLSYADGTVTLFSNQMNGGTQEIVSNFAGARKCLHLHCSGGNSRQYKTKSVTLGKTYTISADYYGTATRTGPLHCELNGGDYSWTPTNSQDYTTPNLWQHVVATYSTPLTSDATLYYFFYCNNGLDCYIKNIKIEEGTSATPWCLADSLIPVNRTIMPDNSGYNNNGTVFNNLSLSSNTPRYSCSTVFEKSKSQCICGGRGALVTDALTASFWLYMADWSTMTRDMRTITTANSCGWYLDPYTADRLHVWVNVGPTTNNNNKRLMVTNVDYTKLSAGWHHMAITYDQQTISYYLDGVLDKSTTWDTKKTIYYTSSTALFLGAKIKNATLPNGGYFDGGMSDVRIYCTPLSADDIKQLYELGAKVDNKGNLHCYEFNETKSNKLTKTGIFYNYATEPYKQLPDGSYWKLMLFHYVDGGNNLFTSSNATYNDGFGLYSRLRDINNFTYNNKYEFYVIQDDIEYRWTLTSLPTASSIAGKTVVSGYTDPVNGLAKANQSNTYIGYGSWWGACGCWTSYSTGGKTGIPGFGSHSAAGICLRYLALYARIDAITYKNATNSHYANNLIEF